MDGRTYVDAVFPGGSTRGTGESDEATAQGEG
jgi:hypothetical protein